MHTPEFIGLFNCPFNQKLRCAMCLTMIHSPFRLYGNNISTSYIHRHLPDLVFNPIPMPHLITPSLNGVCFRYTLSILQLFYSFCQIVPSPCKQSQRIKDLTCLKKCHMSIQEMKVYLNLCLQGESTIPERQEILIHKREALLASIEELNECVAYADCKQSF